jgi:chromosome segregation ATPase
MLAGCSWFPPPPPPPAAALKVAPVVVEVSPMEFLRRSRLMSGDELKAVSDRLASATTPTQRLHAAIALAAPAHPARDEVQARRIVEEVAVSDVSTPVRQFAELYADVLAERTEASAAIRRMETRTREDEKRIEGLEARVRDAERRAGDAERRASESDKKLEALKQIDKALSDRQSPRPAPNGPR